MPALLVGAGASFSSGIPVPDGTFATPAWVTIGPTGGVYVSDFEAMKVLRFSPAGQLRASWGEPGSAPGQFDRPTGIAIGPDGSVVVADANNHRLQVFDQGGKLLRVIQSPPAGSPGHPETPRGIAISSSRVLAIADFDDASVALFRWNLYRRDCARRRGGEPSPVGLHQPYGVAFDGAGHLWVADRAGAQLVMLSGPASPEGAIWYIGNSTAWAIQPTDLDFRDGQLIYLDYGQQRILSVPAP